MFAGKHSLPYTPSDATAAGTTDPRTHTHMEKRAPLTQGNRQKWNLTEHMMDDAQQVQGMDRELHWQLCLHVWPLFSSYTSVFPCFFLSKQPLSLLSPLEIYLPSSCQEIYVASLLPRCLFPASHSISHPHGQWYPPQTVRCSPADPWCWMSPLAHGDEASLGADGSLVGL